MEEAKHTPGPWTAQKDSSGFWNVCHAAGFVVGSEGIFYGKTEEEDTANASLIAAAPDMLEALELTTHCLRWHHERNGRDSHADHNALEAANAAIRKATGSAE